MKTTDQPRVKTDRESTSVDGGVALSPDENAHLRLLLDVSTKAMRVATVDLLSVKDRAASVLDSVLLSRLAQSIGELREAAVKNDAALAGSGKQPIPQPEACEPVPPAARLTAAEAENNGFALLAEVCDELHAAARELDIASGHLDADYAQSARVAAHSAERIRTTALKAVEQFRAQKRP